MTSIRRFAASARFLSMLAFVLPLDFCDSMRVLCFSRKLSETGENQGVADDLAKVPHEH